MQSDDSWVKTNGHKIEQLTCLGDQSGDQDDGEAGRALTMCAEHHMGPPANAWHGIEKSGSFMRSRHSKSPEGFSAAGLLRMQQGVASLKRRDPERVRSPRSGGHCDRPFMLWLQSEPLPLGARVHP